MSRISRKLQRWTQEILDLPQDLLYDLPRLTLIGNHELHIENHKGVIHFSSDKLVLSLAQGALEITGTELSIRSIQSTEVTLQGRVERIQYIERGEKP
ncbi:sporulation protein YqfC [Paenibacillus sp. F411]|uniref:Sporulation protein YqfC n=1 Tax=Paenibacillus algicola TaxID=2565926 RepID=A0A4P8XIX6_9BACL|nr:MULTISPECIES: sporulation protein YqfC [Paenibacillus]MBO2943258.1 sporulation protein YqfC [Paenibacillus sp. F411]QCT02183.1 sporulation protein YqfC [Paenibacillus algicola]